MCHSNDAVKIRQIIYIFVSGGFLVILFHIRLFISDFSQQFVVWVQHK